MGKKEFFIRAKVWSVGFLTVSIILGLVVLLFIPDESFAKLEQTLSFSKKDKSQDVSSLRQETTKLSNQVKSLESRQVEQNKRIDELLAKIESQASQAVAQNLSASKSTETKRTVASAQQSSNTSSNSTAKSTASQPPSANKIATPSAPSDASKKINLNSASAAELDLLPGIGPTYAGRIIDYREANGGFKSIEQIQNVKGIGPKTFEKLRDKIEV